MLLMHRLAGDPEGLSNLLPRPTEVSSVVDVELFQLLDQISQGGDSRQAQARIVAIDCLIELI